MENPYQSPLSEGGVVGVNSGNREDLRNVAKYQRGILFCILFYFILLVGSFAVPPSLKPLLGIAFLILGIGAAVFTFMLAIKVYSTGFGVFMGILALIPIVGFFCLLIINSKATSVLQANGIRVGLMGANPSRI